MPLQIPGLEEFPLREIENQHHNFNFKFRQPTSYRLSNPMPNVAAIDRYNATTKNIQTAIQLNVINQLRTRALGSNWSFTKVGYAKDRIIDTKRLRLKMSLAANHLDDLCDYTTDDLIFLQAGNTIMDINAKLEGDPVAKKSIRASGASNGQTIAGAMSTNTHGSAFEVGSVHDMVVGLHIVTGANSHVFVDRASDPVVSDAFVQAIGAAHIRDDETFNAAVVSFGSMGVIHGVILRTEPIFLLEKYRERVALTDDLLKTMDTLDFSHIHLPVPENSQRKLYHWSLVLNPYKLNDGERGAYLTTIYKIPYDATHQERTLGDRGYTYGDDTLGIVDRLIRGLRMWGWGGRFAIKRLANRLTRLQYPDNQQFPWVGTMGETFNYTSLRGRAASMAVGVDVSNTSKAVKILLDLVKNDKPMPGVVGIRYVKGTEATLGFTKFSTTCIFELDGVDTPLMHECYDLLLQKLNEQNIPFTLHWGKMNDYLNEETLQKMYTKPKINSWLRVRSQLLQTDEVRAVFTNEFMEKCGLDKVIAPVPQPQDPAIV